MKIDAREIAALTQAQPAAPRMDMYASIHKALRAFMADTLLGLGRMDVDDDLEFAQTCDRVMQLLDLCRAHLHHENQFVHAAMEARQPGSSQNIAGEHLEHEQAITALADGVNHLMACAKPARPAATLALYRQLAKEVPGVAFTASGGISSEAELLELQQLGTAAAILGKSLYTGALDLARCVQLVQD